jgi:hypothetical protein
MAIRDPDREQKIRAARLRGELLNEYDENYLIRCLDETPPIVEERTRMTERPALQAVDEQGNPTDMRELEEAGVAFDPTTQHLDLSRDEKRRTTALMMAIQAYNQLIIREAAYLTAAADLARRNEGPAIHPATVDAMVVCAIKFDDFIAGRLTQSVEPPPEKPRAESEEHAATGFVAT